MTTNQLYCLTAFMHVLGIAGAWFMYKTAPEMSLGGDTTRDDAKFGLHISLYIGFIFAYFVVGMAIVAALLYPFFVLHRRLDAWFETLRAKQVDTKREQ